MLDVGAEDHHSKDQRLGFMPKFPYFQIVPKKKNDKNVKHVTLELVMEDLQWREFAFTFILGFT